MRLFGAVTSHDESGNAERDPSTANATLAALESALASATAMTMWSAARANTLRVAYPNVGSPISIYEDSGPYALYMLPTNTIAPVNGSTTVVERRLVGHITVSNPTVSGRLCSLRSLV